MHPSFQAQSLVYSNAKIHILLHMHFRASMDMSLPTQMYVVISTLVSGALKIY